jgi:hypothetical protein
VRVWQHDAVLRWHAVVIAPDSVSGIPWLQPIDCDSCRIAVPRATVDSLQVGNPSGGWWKTVGIALGLMALSGCLVVGC